jgi:hypothetical protein
MLEDVPEFMELRDRVSYLETLVAMLIRDKQVAQDILTEQMEPTLGDYTYTTFLKAIRSQILPVHDILAAVLREEAAQSGRRL